MTDAQYKKAKKARQIEKLRDRYAGQAMQGILAARAPNALHAELSDGTMLMISETSYKMANAMLVARGEAL